MLEANVIAIMFFFFFLLNFLLMSLHFKELENKDAICQSLMSSDEVTTTELSEDKGELFLNHLLQRDQFSA